MIKIGKKGYTPLGILWIIVEYVSLIFFDYTILTTGK